VTSTKNALRVFQLRTGGILDRGEDFNAGSDAWITGCVSARDLVNGAIAIQNDLDGGTVASPSKFFQYRAAWAYQNSPSHRQCGFLASPVANVAVRYISPANGASSA